MHSTHCVLLEGVLSKYDELKGSYHFNEKWSQMDDAELWEELCLCILSSNVPYELAQSSFLHLKNKGLLVVSRIVNSPNMRLVIAKELARPIYLPRKRDGELRKYRFPNAKARNIIESAHTISFKKLSISEILESNQNEIQLRNYFTNEFKGLGLKQSSHFLRNIGFSKKLAIIDTHVVRFLDRMNGLITAKARLITPHMYLKFENSFLELCESLKLDPAVFDFAIWNYMRES